MVQIKMSPAPCGCCGKLSGNAIETCRTLCKRIPHALWPNLGVVGKKRLWRRWGKDHKILVASNSCATENNQCGGGFIHSWGRERDREQGGKYINQSNLHSFHSRLKHEIKLELENLQMIAEWLSSKLVNIFSQVMPEGGKEFYQHQEMIS